MTDDELDYSVLYDDPNQEDGVILYEWFLQTPAWRSLDVYYDDKVDVFHIADLLK